MTRKKGVLSYLIGLVKAYKSTFTGLASVLIFPQDTASSGLAPESEPSNSWPVLTNTA